MAGAAGARRFSTAAVFDLDRVAPTPVAIPKAVRERVHITPGEKLQAPGFDDRMELARTRPMRKTRGFLRGLDATFVRDENDRT